MIGHITCGVVSGLSTWLIGKAYYAFRIDGGIYGTDKEINKKISGYKQQDRIKNRYDETQFLTLESVIVQMVECELKCRYCRGEMNVIYDISRESRQWSVDRINNDLGHNLTNFHLACLECNLKRRRRTDEKFLFTKQLNIIKKMQ